MRTVTTAAVLALTFALGACAAGTTQGEFTRTDAEAVRKTAADLSAAFNQKAIDKLVELYADSSVFMPPNAPTLRGREPLKSFYTDLSGKWSELRMEAADVAGHGPIAYQSGTYTLTSADARDRGKYLIVMRNMGGNWRVEYTAWNSDLPKPAGN